MALSFMKNYPRKGLAKTLLPRRAPFEAPRSIRLIMRRVREVVHFLAGAMIEVSPLHFFHRNNNIPHFPGALGSVDTFPIWVGDGPGRYAPKYKKPVLKFQIVSTHLGLVAHLTGPHLGSESDTTIFRMNPPPMVGGQYLLGDKAYISVPLCLAPLKINDAHFSRANRHLFNRLHGHYRARVEQTIRALKVWGCLAGRWRSSNFVLLKEVVIIIANLRSLMCCFKLPYPPYTPI